ncbi:hypothetical protein L3Q82_002577 [Scortum barcoo]|uniref:Uncharacterized protein n=1 Tax=Scortum barcoo TaxID=214431 RepID=A0ACB8VTZ6_9TELE|nr:hypothetical protein L3Q82_002577 [Scortum barcoo]
MLCPRLLFCIGLNPLRQIIAKTGYAYRLRNGATISYLLYMDDIKLYAKSERDIDSLIRTTRIYSNDIGMTFRLDKCGRMVVCVFVLLTGRVSPAELTCETLILLSTNLTARTLVLLNQTFTISNTSGQPRDNSLSSVSWVLLPVGHAWNTSLGRRPGGKSETDAPEPPQLTPLNVKEQRLYSELLPNPQSTCGLVGQTPINPQAPCMEGIELVQCSTTRNENRIVPPESEGRLLVRILLSSTGRLRSVIPL